MGLLRKNRTDVKETVREKTVLQNQNEIIKK